MNHLYAFLEIETEVDPVLPGISEVGELTPYCKTFVPANADPYINVKGDCSLYFFKGEFADSNGSNISNYTGALNALADRIQTAASPNQLWKGDALPIANTTTWVGGKLNGLHLTHTITTLSAGTQVTLPVANTNIPDYFEVTCTNIEPYTIHVWVKHSKFKEEYPLAHYTVVPPILPNELTPNDYSANLQFVNGNFSAIKAIITGRTLSQHVDNAQTGLAGKAITGMESVTLRAYNPANPADYFDCPFFIGYNGEAGVNWVGIVEAIMSFFIGIGGGYDEDDWNLVFPQLSSLGTYYIIPVWNREAIPNPNPTLPAIMYNPMQKLDLGGNAITDIIKTTYFSGVDIAYSLNDVKELLEYGASSYKSIGYFVIPDPNNDNGDPVSFAERFTDYIVANINTLGSSNISVITENIIRDIHMTLQQAELWEDTNNAPEGYAIELINGFRYMSLVNPYGRAKMYVLTLDGNTHTIN